MSPQGRDILGIGLGLLGGILIVRGRILTWRLTEGEALVALWPLWLLALALLFAAGALLFWRRP